MKLKYIYVCEECEKVYYSDPKGLPCVVCGCLVFYAEGRESY